MGCEKETRFLSSWGGLLGQRNRVSSVGITSYLWQRERNPVSRFMGWLLGHRNRVSSVGITSYLWEAKKKPGFFCWGKETGFLLWVSGVICGSEKETRFLGFWGWLLGQRNRVSVVNITSYL